MFQIGQQVVYPVHGAGVIESVETRDILGESKEYYVLRLSAGDLQVLIPVDGVENAGLRKVCDQATLACVKNILADQPENWDDNWNHRYRMNMNKIKSGDIKEIAVVVRDLALRDLDKGLSAGEKKMLDNAKKVLISEMVMASGCSTQQINDELQLLFAERADKQGEIL